MNDKSEKLEQILREGLAEIKRLRGKLKQRQTKKYQPIAIIGMSCRFPGGLNTPEEFWSFLSQGKDAITEIPSNRWDIDHYYDAKLNTPGKMNTRFGGFIKNIDLFDHQFFNITPREAKFIDPQQRLMLELTWEAFENAGISPFSLTDRTVGVFIGAATSEYGALIIKNNNISNFVAEFGTSLSPSAISGRVSYYYNFQGPCMTVDTACSSSIVSLHEACNSLRLNEANLAIAGGVQIILLPEVNVTLSQAHMLSPDGHCKTFDVSANGYVRSEGAGLVLLKRLDDAIADSDPILAVIRGTSISQDGASSSLTVPNGIAQENLINDTLKKAGLLASDISQIEAHGTGTELGDPIEFAALKEIFSRNRNNENPLYLTSVKANMGHAEVSAGIMALIKQILSLQHKEIAPQIHFKTINPKINLNAIPAVIPTDLIKWQVPSGKKRYVGISSFGFTGIIAHTILEEAPQKLDVKFDAIPDFHLVTISAKTKKALIDLIDSYSKLIKGNPKLDLADFAYTQNLGREDFSWRVAITAATLGEFLSKISSQEYVMDNTSGKKSQDIVFEYVDAATEPKIHKSQYLKKIYLNTKSTLADILPQIGDDYLHGARIDWLSFYKPYRLNKIILPNYPFQRNKHWLDFTNSTGKFEGRRFAEIDFEVLAQDVEKLKKTVFGNQTEPVNADRPSIADKVHNLATKILEIDDIVELNNKSLFDIGMNSLTMNEFRLLLNESFHCDLPISFIATAPKLDEIVDEIFNQIITAGSAKLASSSQLSWIEFRKRQPSPAVKLFCFAYSGVGASCYHDWQSKLPPEIEVCPIQFPGRETRYEEVAIDNLDDLLSQLYFSIRGELNTDFALFGHSIGGLYAHEFMKLVERRTGKLPVQLFISAVIPPQKIAEQNIILLKRLQQEKMDLDLLDKIDDKEFLRYMKIAIDLFHLENDFDITVLSEQQIAAHRPLIKNLINDMKLQMSYTYQESKKVDCSVSIIGGENDPLITQVNLLEWQQLFQQKVDLHMISGGHLFIHSHQNELISLVTSKLT